MATFLRHQYSHLIYAATRLLNYLLTLNFSTKIISLRAFYSHRVETAGRCPVFRVVDLRLVIGRQREPCKNG